MEDSWANMSYKTEQNYIFFLTKENALGSTNNEMTDSDEDIQSYKKRSKDYQINILQLCLI